MTPQELAALADSPKTWEIVLLLLAMVALRALADW
jgi:hypothetical protein